MRALATAALVALLLICVSPGAGALPGGECSGVVDVLCEESTTVCHGEICYTEHRYCAAWIMDTGLDWPQDGEPPVCMAGSG